MLRLAVDDEVRGIGEQVRKLLRGQSDEPDVDASRTHRARPLALASMVDERRQHDRHVAFQQFAGGERHFVPGPARQRSGVGQVHARQS